MSKSFGKCRKSQEPLWDNVHLMISLNRCEWLYQKQQNYILKILFCWILDVVCTFQLCWSSIIVVLKNIRCGIADPDFYWRQGYDHLYDQKLFTVDYAFEGKIGISAPNWVYLLLKTNNTWGYKASCTSYQPHDNVDQFQTLGMKKNILKIPWIGKISVSVHSLSIVSPRKDHWWKLPNIADGETVFPGSRY